MAEDEKPFGSDDEYHFNEPESANVYGEIPIQSSNTQANIKRYALIGIGILLLLFAIFKVITIFFGHPKTTTVISKPVATKPVQTFTQPKVDLSQTTQAISQISNQLQSLSQHSQEHQTELQALKENLSSIDARLSDLDTKLDTVNTAISQLSSQVVALKPKPKPRRRRVVRKRRTLMKQYYLRAAVPGRAWLQRSDGTAITVSIGTYVPGYGTVN